MVNIQIPYHTSYQTLQVSDHNLKAILTPAAHNSSNLSGEAIVREALQNSIGTPSLRELAKDKSRIVLVTSDHTRAMPSSITLPILLSEIRLGNPDADITILIATGLHRATTEAEQRSMFGDQIVDNEKIVVNDAFKKEDFEFICTLPSQAGFNVNKLAVDCDLLIAEGFIEPHFFAGFSGGRKSILPGICSEETVNENHSYMAIAHSCARGGVLDNNPIHQDMIYAARKVNLQYILNVVMDEKKQIIAAYAGDFEEAHHEGVKFIRKIAERPAVSGDIVVTSNGGFPLDQNLYQAPKAATTAEICAEDDGVIIICAHCSDGMGGEYFEKLICSGTPEDIDRRLAEIPPKETIPEQWCAQIFSRILMRHPIILVSGLDPGVVKSANMIPAATLNEAMDIAYGIKGKDAKVVVIPDGVSVITVG